MRAKRDWVLLRCLLSLHDEASRDVIVRTRHALAFDISRDVMMLPSLLAAVQSGGIDPKTLSWRGPRLVLGADPCSVSGSEQHANRIPWEEKGADAWSRFEVVFRRSQRANQATLVDYDTHAVCDLEFLSKGRGATGTVARALGLYGEPHSIFQDEEGCKLIATVPARISRLKQTADRSAIAVEVDARGDLLPRLRLVPMPIGAGLSRIRKLSVTQPRTLVPLDSDGPMHLTLLLDDLPLQTEEIKPIPRGRTNARVIALATFEDGKALLRQGLLPNASRANDWFERSVAHLFGAAGLTTFWWGPNRSKLDCPVPTDAADLIAMPANDAFVALVDCTVDTFAKDKLHKLVQRAQQVRDALALSNSRSPPVIPVLATSVPLRHVARSAKELVRADGGVVLGREQLEKLADLVESGAHYDELQAALPEKLRSDRAAQHLLPIF